MSFLLNRTSLPFTSLIGGPTKLFSRNHALSRAISQPQSTPSYVLLVFLFLLAVVTFTRWNADFNSTLPSILLCTRSRARCDRGLMSGLAILPHPGLFTYNIPGTTRVYQSLCHLAAGYSTTPDCYSASHSSYTHRSTPRLHIELNHPMELKMLAIGCRKRHLCGEALQGCGRRPHATKAPARISLNDSGRSTSGSCSTDSSK